MTRNRRLLYGGVAAGVALIAIAAVVTFAPGARRAAPRAQPRDQAVQDAQAMQGAKRMEMGEQRDTTPMGGDMAGMQMGGTSSDGSIRLTANEIGTFGITFGTVDVRPLERTIRAVGIVEFDETRMAYVSPKFGGWVERLHVDFTGQPVREGQALLEVYSPELVTAQEELLLAARLADSVESSRVAGVAASAVDLRESALRRLRYWDISEPQIQRLLETGAVSKTLTLHAPASGIVMEKDVFDGQAFEAGDNLYMIADLSRVWVNAEVFERDAGLVRDGMPAEITVDALPGRTLDGRIEYVYPTLEDRTRSMRARVTVPNPGGALKPGMYATMKFSARLGEALTVPASAILHSGERAVAFVDMGSGRILPHEVRLGVAAGEVIEVIDGLEPGQRVVTSAQYLLDSESNLAEVMKAMMSQMNLSDMEGMPMDMDMDGMN